MEAYRSKYYRPGVVLGVGFALGQQSTGINVIVAQSNTLYNEILPPQYCTALSVLQAAMFAVCILFTILAIDKFVEEVLDYRT